MTIDNFKVYDLAESIVASGLPMVTEYNADDFSIDASANGVWRDSKHFQRMVKLASNPASSGHCNALSGILVSANVTATIKWWHQMERYHFVQIVSSMSTMHRLRQMLKNNRGCFNEKVVAEAVCFAFESAESLLTDEELAYSCPLGLELTARITTNYLQLKTIYAQRKAHKLTEWRDFCEWIKELPFAKEFITGDC